MTQTIAIIVSGGLVADVLLPEGLDLTYIVADFDDFEGGVGEEWHDDVRDVLAALEEHYPNDPNTKDWRDELLKDGLIEPPEASLVTGWDPQRGPTYE